MLKDLLKKDLKDLRRDYQALAKEEMALRFQLCAKQLKDTSLLAKKRRQKARIQTACHILAIKKGEK